VRWTEASNRISRGESLLFAFERIVNRIPAGGPASAVAVSHFSRYTGDWTKTPDRVLDFCGPLERRPTPTWFVMFDGGFGETGALNALFVGCPPLVEVVDGSTRAVVAFARPGTDRGGVILSAFEDCLRRTTTLLLAALGLSVAPGSEFSPRSGAGACRMEASEGGSAEGIHAGSDQEMIDLHSKGRPDPRHASRRGRAAGMRSGKWE
jgi:hypothetical protein